MKQSIFYKIFGGYLIIIISLSLLIPFITFKLIRNNYVNTLTENLKNIAITLQPDIHSLLERHDMNTLDSFVKDTGQKINARISVINRDGTVIADSARDPRTMENHRTRPEVIDALSGSIGSALRFSVTLEEETLYVALPLEKTGKPLTVLRLSLTLKQINTLIASVKVRMVQIALIFTFLSLIIAFIISRGFSRSIHLIIDGAKGLAQGDFSTRVYLRNKDELQQLATGFNEMAEKMGALFAELRGRHEELNIILSSIEEILIVLDTEGMIKLGNESFKKMAGISNVEGLFYWEVLRSPGFSELVKRVSVEKKNITDEIEIYNRNFLCSVSFLSSGEIILVLHDITDLKQLERVKKDVVANISHELRTPLTAIKGFVETLEAEEEIKNVQYLEIIKRHTDRLINIVNDLLVLSELEEKATPLKYEEVLLPHLIENILKIFHDKAKGISLRVVAEPDFPAIKADAFQLEQMFINLIDNAIKYTEHGEVEVRIRQDKERVIIEVQDTGIGIPPEYQSRIFERFFVVDKSRSKRLGGTGLGLAIVKHIVLLHNGTIDVESKPGRGTRFTITLPLRSNYENEN